MSASTGSFTANTQSSTPVLATARRMLTISLSGTWAATVALQRSFDSGSTWITVSSWTANTEVNVETHSDSTVQWKLATTAYTSGTVVARLQVGDY